MRSAVRSDYGAASGFERQRLLIAIGFSYLQQQSDYNTAVYSWDRLPYLSHVSGPCSGRRTLSNSLTGEREAALLSNLYIFRRLRRCILRSNIGTSRAVNPSLDKKNVCDDTCSMKVIAEPSVGDDLLLYAVGGWVWVGDSRVRHPRGLRGTPHPAESGCHMCQRSRYACGRASLHTPLMCSKPACLVDNFLQPATTHRPLLVRI